MKLGINIFYSIRPKKFKKPVKRTDLCRVCVAGGKVKKLYRFAVTTQGSNSEQALRPKEVYPDYMDQKMLVDEQRSRISSLDGNLGNSFTIITYDF
ncbi:hypothetical protein AYI68_g4224 [Smittium mucronatum]|uniref:Uncharacterized protein n=1 Tax=Smittium mucronatum TaxID=133383 RepID=A0A1R0GXQ1_9FUNG|nr:hypothetical protein AYI68_g4224 [Smittium mucronatum]